MRTKGLARLLVTVVTALTMLMTSVNVQAYSWNSSKDADVVYLDWKCLLWSKWD